ncbi:MAG: hypothetical protein LAT65_16645 [Saccharospirillum sp.]|nr:hypothetical protein [Saccharospirillum sp.]
MQRRRSSLYALLPEYIRQQDRNQHTRRLLSGIDQVLDRFQGSLEQYYRDNFPDTDGLPEQDGAAQEWLLPYFADLLDAQLLSPLAEGRRTEVTEAIRWRQAKGTRKTVDEVAEGVGQWETVIQEGWTRVARTARLDEPLLQEHLYGITTPLNPAIPQEVAKHPALVSVTPDMRCGSRAVLDDNQAVFSQVSTIEGQSVRWRQHYRHGVPCHHQRIDAEGHFHGAAFDDVSLRTPDMRDGDWRVGHIHPRRVLIHLVQPEGHFPSRQPADHRVFWRQEWLDTDTLPSKAFLKAVTLYCRLDGTLVFEGRFLHEPAFTPVNVRGVFALGQVPLTGVGDADDDAWHFAGLALRNRIEADSGRVSFDRCAVAHVQVHSIDMTTPVITARDTLFSSVQTARSLTRLEYCTVLDRCVVEGLQASDCLFTCSIRKDHATDIPPEELCLRYSRVISAQQPEGIGEKNRNTRERPVFFGAAFGDSGAGVLHPASDEAIRTGAEDGSEMGAFHFLHLSLRVQAVQDKLQAYLPIGQEAVLIPDAGLAKLPATN